MLNQHNRYHDAIYVYISATEYYGVDSDVYVVLRSEPRGYRVLQRKYPSLLHYKPLQHYVALCSAL